jgi:hypothetical protein
MVFNSSITTSVSLSLCIESQLKDRIRVIDPVVFPVAD